MTADLHGCVAAGHPVTAHAAHEVLRAGGNAFDAALAAVAAACVAESVLASPGGGGFLLARPAQGPARIYDFFVQTPRVRRPAEESSAHPIVTDWGTTQQEFQIGPGTAATPGLVRGLFAVHAALGRMPMPQILAPAVLAAREGVVVTPFQAYLMTLVAPIYLGEPDARALFGNPEGGSLNRGDRMHNPDLGALFEQLGRDGERLFHEGEVAAAIVKQCRDQGGHITRDDLVNYRVRVREPLTLRYRDATIITNPPPSAGGSLIAFGLGLLGRVPLQGLGFASPEHLALLARVLARTVDARAAHRNLEHLLAAAVLDEHGAALLHELAAARAAHRGTTHISVIDRDGNAASVTLSNGEGCGSLIPGTGVMLNNMLGEEDLQPGEPLPPGARMGSMMAPTLVAWPDGRRVALGTGGSERIRSAILCVLARLLDEGEHIADAVAAPRVHVSGDEVVHVEPGLDDASLGAIAELVAARGWPAYDAWPTTNIYFGGVHAVERGADGTVTAVGDARRGGAAAVVRPDGDVVSAWSEG